MLGRHLCYHYTIGAQYIDRECIGLRLNPTNAKQLMLCVFSYVNTKINKSMYSFQKYIPCHTILFSKNWYIYLYNIHCLWFIMCIPTYCFSTQKTIFTYNIKIDFYHECIKIQTSSFSPQNYPQWTTHHLRSLWICTYEWSTGDDSFETIWCDVYLLSIHIIFVWISM